MIEFPDLTDCKDCPLHESAENPGIPTRPFSVKGHDTAMLVVGEAPGFHEDQEHTSWVGKAGTILTKFLEAAEFGTYADVYLANACRCRPPQNEDPSVGQANTCRVHLQKDLDLICNAYKNVIIFCVGRWGTTAVTKQTKLTSCFAKQGQSLSTFNSLKPGGLESSKDIRCFFTYHPAMLFSHRKPSLVTAVGDHFKLLLRFLKGEFIPNSLEVIPKFAAKIPQYLPNLIAVDIETYGILKGVNQTVFHPMKSQEVDKVPLGDQVITVAFGFEDPDSPTRYSTYVYDFKKHKHIIREWFRRIVSQPNTTVLGQNIKFDIMYLKMNDRILNIIINPCLIKLDDLLLASFLHYEQRPEKGLKELATLFGITDYNRLTVTGSSGTAKSSYDPDLHYYNCMDVAVTLALHKFTWGEIEKKYGKDSPKLSTTCTLMRNAVLWDTICLETAGFAMSIPGLRKLEVELQQQSKKCIDEAAEHGVTIQGDGSDRSTREFMEKAFGTLGLLDDKQVQFTPKKHDISVNKDNFNFLLNHSKETDSHWTVLQGLMMFHKVSKLLNSYVTKLLRSPAEGLVRRVAAGYMGIAYPSWYPIPSVAARYEQEKEAKGGTIQGRFSAKKPAAQTFPSVVKAHTVSRFPHGRIAGYDLSQIELRVPALSSGDPVMMEEYVRGIDRHKETAMLIFPDADPNDPEFSAEGHFGQHKRELGKTLNFLVLFRGGAKKFQETALNEYGVIIPLSRCKGVIEEFDRKYKVFRKWQDDNIATVRSQGYLELLTGWSRTWTTKADAKGVTSEICDFPIQTIAAQLLQSAHFEIEKELWSRHLKARIILQIHDALYIDYPMDEEKIIDLIMEKHLTSPPLLAIIERELGRSVPILYEKKILS